MRVYAISDVHLDHGHTMQDLLNTTPADAKQSILVIAGDISTWTSRYLTLDLVINMGLAFKHVVFILGNHDFFGSTYQITTQHWYKQKTPSNVTFLEQEYVDISGIRFFGCTAFSVIDRDERENVMQRVGDFSLIDDWSPAMSRKVFLTSTKWLKQSIQQTPAYLKIVVVTHHLPSKTCIAPQFANSQLNSAYNNGLLDPDSTFCLDDMIASRIKVWIAGHTHTRIITQIPTQSDGLIIVNPLGYPTDIHQGGHTFQPIDL